MTSYLSFSALVGGFPRAGSDTSASAFLFFPRLFFVLLSLPSEELETLEEREDACASNGTFEGGIDVGAEDDKDVPPPDGPSDSPLGPSGGD